MNFFLESCCTSLQQVIRAQEKGASRIELCENLPVGGVTPSRALLEAVMAAATVPVNVLVRPRGGDFRYNESEIREMLSSIDLCHSLGASGVVIGALDAAGDIDMPLMRRLMEAARPMSVTFHRAFDECREPLQAFEDVILLGCDRLLTSGHSSDAYVGRFFIAELVKKAAGRIIVMPGCGVRLSNIEEIRRDTHSSEFHASESFFL